MSDKITSRLRHVCAGIVSILLTGTASAESLHGIAMYGDPALPQDFVSLPYANPNAPKGGKVVFGNTGGFDSLNPFIQKGSAPWQWRFWGYESLMGRSWDEPFTLYGLLAESVQTAEDRSWVEFTLREEARFWDGSPVTVEDVIWSYETLGTKGNLRYRSFWTKIAQIEQTGPRRLRIRFNTADRELALIAGLRPILKKAQWQDKDFTASGFETVPMGTGAYQVGDFEAGRYLSLKRDPDYWGKDLPFRRGTQNFDELRIEFYGDGNVLFEAFKAGAISVVRENNAEDWANQYDFPAIARGDVVKSVIPHQRPSGIRGLVMNTRRAPFDDWRVREAMLLAFNFDYINDTMTGGAQPRITSYFSGSILGMQDGPAQGLVRDLLLPYAAELPPGALEGYQLPESDGNARNRKALRAADALLQEAGWHVENGKRVNAQGVPFVFDALLRQADTESQTILQLYKPALERLGIDMRVQITDEAQYKGREASLDFDMAYMRRDLSLSPGNEQRLYWGREAADAEGTRNLMGVRAPAIDAMIAHMLNATNQQEFRAATRALDRILTAGRYVIPYWQFDKGRIAHIREMRFPERLPIYGDGVGFLPDVWWYEAGSD